jgi:hypothetical protein
MWPTVKKLVFSVATHEETGRWVDHQISTRRSGIIVVRRDMKCRFVTGLPQLLPDLCRKYILQGLSGKGWQLATNTTPSPKVKNTWNYNPVPTYVFELRA